jgi:Zn-finger nucleic acid-binding protein
MHLHCPIDHVALVALVVYDTEINYCPKSRLWVDPREFRQIDPLAPTRPLR